MPEHRQFVQLLLLAENSFRPLLELPFRPDPLGNVGGHAEGVDFLPVRGGDGSLDHGQPVLLAPGVDHRLRGNVHFPPPVDNVPIIAPDPFGLLRPAVHAVVQAAGQLIDGSAVHVGGGPVGQGKPSGLVLGEDHVRVDVDDVAQVGALAVELGGRLLLAGDVADDDDQLAAPDRDDPRLVVGHPIPDRDAVLERERPTRLHHLVERLTKHLGGCFIRNVGDLPADESLRSQAEVGGRTAAAVENDAGGIDAKHDIGKGPEDRPHVRVGLKELLGAQIDRALEHGPVAVELDIGAVDEIQEVVDPRRDGVLLTKAAPDLPAQKAVHRFQAAFSSKVVMVIVWL